MKYSAGMRGHNHSKHTQYKKQHTISRDVQRGRRRGMRIVALVMAVLMLAGVVCSALVGTEDVAEAATTETLNVSDRWTAKKTTLTWSDNTDNKVYNGGSFGVGMWHQYDSDDYVNWIDISECEIEGNSNKKDESVDADGNTVTTKSEYKTEYMIGKVQESSDGKRMALGRLIYKGEATNEADKYVTTVPITTNGTSQEVRIDNSPSAASLDDINTITDIATQTDADDSDETAEESVSALSEADGTDALADEEYAAISGKAYSKKADSATISDSTATGTYYTFVGIDEIYYSIQYCEALDGYYREYYVSTAEQLSLILRYYSSETKQISYIKATTGDIETAFGISGKSGVNKLGIRLLCDIDLGGSSEKLWKAYRNREIYLDIQGDGHYIYNGYLNKFLYNSTDSTKFSDDSCSDKFVAISNLTFSNMYLTSAWGMFSGADNCCFSNVNFEKCLAGLTSSSSGTTLLFGNKYYNCYLKDCTIRESYLYGWHCGMYGSWGNGDGDTNVAESATYISDNTAASGGYYRTTIPETLTDTEWIWKGKVNSDDNDNKLPSKLTAASIYPTIFEGCAVVDSEVYDTGSHSGTFISCTTSCDIFRNCFSNATIYGTRQTGVFCGACIGCSNGFYYDVDSVRTLVNTVFENCYTFGAVEGQSFIGGFIGTVYADSRADDTNRRGKVIFENCYSTSSVGMQYSGICVGGFVGFVQNDYKGTANEKSSGATYDTQHVFKNCYAAGETGGISTDTSTDATNTTSIGGFIGTCHTGSANEEGWSDTYKPSLTGCYYDRQTTAMREKDIGRLASGNDNTYGANKNYSKVDNSIWCKFSATGTLNGLTGVYTKSSSSKGVAGLTDTVRFSDDSSWTYWTDYYPQLSAFVKGGRGSSVADTVSTSDSSELAESLISKMKSDRQTLYYDCSMASAAAVFLNHYDETMNEDNGTVESTSDAAVYDTVRDITSKFTFTSVDEDNKKGSANNSKIAWVIDDALNGTHEFTSKFGVKYSSGTSVSTSGGFTVSYDTEKNGKSYSRTFEPTVVNIQEIDNEYRCVDFAPGKQWVTVTYGEGELQGQRHLRLLPTAYLNAGNIITVSVKDDAADDASKNIVYVNNDADSSGSIIQTELSSFNHAVGVVYAISDKNRMADTTIYGNQTISAYSENDTGSFAMYGKYPVGEAGITVSTMKEQKFAMNTAETINGATNTNNSSDGKTIVRVYRAVASTDSDELIQGDEISYSVDNNLEKWQGTVKFTSKDAGYYYMVYDWRLNDGRYLEDKKLVRIVTDSYSVEMVTGIMNEEHEIATETGADGTTKVSTPIDQFVTDEITTGSTTGTEIHTWDTYYPSDTASTAYELETAYTGGYNIEKTYGADAYFIKSLSKTTAKSNCAVEWRRSTDYMLTSLIIEAYDSSTNTWKQMARVDGSEASTSVISFENAEYSYEIPQYEVTQNPETKLFTVTKTGVNTRTFMVEPSSRASANGIENYIEFEFATSGSAFADLETNIRVTALFRKNNADIAGEKYVLAGDLASEKLLDGSTDTVDTAATAEATDTTDENTGVTYESSSIDIVDFDNEVDDTDETKLEERKAVMPGTELTYRVKLTNAGYMDSSEVQIFDTVPDGTTYVADSMRIIRQDKDILDGNTKYAAPVVVAKYTKNYSGDSVFTVYGDSDNVIYQANDSETENKTGYNMVQPDESGAGTTASRDLKWTIPNITLIEDYYVEYKVIVDSDYLKASDLSSLLVNTAQWEFVSLNGDLSDDSYAGNTSISTYKNYAVFDMNVAVDEDTAVTQKRTYTIDFKQNDTTNSYKEIYFENTFPTEFDYDDTFGIQLYRVDSNASTETLIATWKKSGLTKTEESNISISGYNNYFRIDGLSMDELQSGAKYVVKFRGTQVKLGNTTSDGKILTEIKNHSSVMYTKTSSTGQSTTMGNSIARTERLTNQVETDVTWHYIDIQKTVSEADAEQSFLMKVSYYADKTKLSSGAAADGVWYTRVNCTEEVTDESGKATGYTGHSYFELPMTGWYTVEEVTGWSATDYGGCTVKYKAAKENASDSPTSEEIGTTYTSGHGTTSGNNGSSSLVISKPVTIYVADGTKTDVTADSSQDTSGADIVLYSVAYVTSQGTDVSYWATAAFENTENDYAYLSGQAYQENDISVTK